MFLTRIQVFLIVLRDYIEGSRKAGLGVPMAYRIRDVFIALILAVFLAPLVVSICIFIFLFYGRPIFYSEKRVGLHGAIFTIYKFRTLNKAAKTRRPAGDLEGRIAKNGTPDHCRGPFCQFLRRSSLDELPQIWNVLKGDMSIVGPRPMPRHELNHRFGADAVKVTSVRPGLTGLWQISGRNDLADDQRRALDLYYVETRNSRLDGLILLKTLLAVVSGRGAY